MTNFEKIKAKNVEEMADFLCDNSDCDVCPAYDANYCPNENMKICSKAMKKWLESEV
ncbi:MAG: hypothetical protein IJD45_01100 [Clostridia bacterium]|nr:hypothetical protein [Clostridia bacterium]